MQNKTIGFALCGSFCTLKTAIEQIKALKELGHNVLPIMSETVYNTDTRFGTAAEFISRVEEISGNKIIHTIKEAEPIGPKALLDLLIIAPCTGNTLAKLAYGITDTSVTMAAKAHLRNERPLLIAVSTNDALAAAGKNIGTLLNYKNIYFVPFSQDMPEGKPRSAIADFSLIPGAAVAALNSRQLQPIIF